MIIYFYSITATVLLIGILTLIYHVRSYRALDPQKPSFAFMPKYKFEYDDHDALLDRLNSAGFLQKESSNRYERGHLLGDFSAQVMRLVVDVEASDNRALLKGGSWIVLFDTGDLWKVANSLRGKD